MMILMIISSENNQIVYKTNPNPSPIGLGHGFVLFGAGDRT